MKDEEVIDYILSRLNMNDYIQIDLLHIKDNFDLESVNSVRDIIYKMINLGLIEKSKSSDKSLKLTEKGNDIQDLGGWRKNLAENIIPKENPIISQPKSFFKKLFSNVYVIGVIFLIIEEITLGKIWIKICELINKIN
jgi:predicted transcriptional regulator